MKCEVCVCVCGEGGGGGLNFACVLGALKNRCGIEYLSVTS